MKNSIKSYDYVSFSDGGSSHLKYKDYLQIYSLEKTKKDISCCDYYIYDKILGNYLLADIYKAFLNFKQDKFNQLISLNQIAVSKNYFLKNIDRFKRFFDGGKIDIINSKNTCFVSIPLTKKKKINELDYDVFSYAFQKIFVIEMYSLLKQKNLFFSSYFYRLIYLLSKNQLLLKSFIDIIKDKRNWNQLRI